MDRIEENFDQIYVRENLDGKWETRSLPELPSKLAMKHIFRWLREVMPKDEHETAG